MTKTEVKERIEKLRDLINHHRYLYHVLDKQEISESALDSLKKELFDLEEDYPELMTSDSPTQRIGGKSLDKFVKVRHSEPMISLNDAFSENDIQDWIERISRILAPEEINLLDFFCELKIDGLAIELIYEKGILKKGATRGDGLIGEDVTQNLKTIEAIPLKLRREENSLVDLRKELDVITLKKEIPPILIVRGEAFITKKDFEKLNQEQLKKGLPLYANPRNVAAGSIRQLDPKITSQRRMDSFAYDLLTDLGQNNHEQKHKILKALGFKTNPHNKYCKNLAEIFEFHKYCQHLREKIPYEIDGIVVIVNNDRVFKKLGVVGKAPRGAIAYKFPLKQTTTTIEDIQVQVGRTGALTPVAILKPVQVGGVTISRATLHNEDEIKRLGVRIGDTVIVGRAGDVIPDIIKVLPGLRTGKEKKFRMPVRCPSCGTKLVKPEGEVLWRCPNPDCFARKREYFYHFVSRLAFDMVGLGPRIVDKLIDEGLVQDPADLFDLKEGDVLMLDRFAEKSVGNLIKAIQPKKKINLTRFIYGLGIRNVGEETSIDLAETFSAQDVFPRHIRLGRRPASGWGSIEKLKKASLSDLQKIKDVGPVVAKSIYQWFSQKNNREFLEKLMKSGVEIESQSSRLYQGHNGQAKKQKLKGKIFVLTGSLQTLTRNEAKERIRMLGGEISESVSKNTDFVAAGTDSGSKYKKAKELGIKTLNEKELLRMIGEG